MSTLGRVNFNDTVRNTHGRGPTIIPRWNINREVKHRVWHAFWDNIILNACGEEVRHHPT